MKLPKIRNEDMDAGMPMVFACVGCGFPIWVPECWVIRDKRCPDCGGQWSRAEAEAWLLPGETRA